MLPAAWEYADYAACLRNNLERYFKRYLVIRSRMPLFPDVQEGAVVLVGQGYLQQPEESVQIACTGIEEVISALKAFRNGTTKQQYSRTTSMAEGSVLLRKFLHIQIGAVTGHSSYFLMNEERRKEMSLPVAALRPVLSRSRQLAYPAFTSREWQRLRDNNQRVWLFRPPPSIVDHPSVQKYLSLKPDEGGCNTKASHIQRRASWYYAPLPRGVHGFVSGMSTNGPWIAFNEMTGLTVTNTLYAVTFKNWLSRHDRYAVALALLRRETRESLDSVCRIYPDGLRKHEPKDILSIRIEVPDRRRGVIGTYRNAVGALLRGDIASASKIANSYFAD